MGELQPELNVQLFAGWIERTLRVILQTESQDMNVKWSCYCETLSDPLSSETME